MNYNQYVEEFNMENSKPKYLVRPDDFGIFELDNTNGCYNRRLKPQFKYPDETPVHAREHFTFENLTNNYGFFAIDETELELYEHKCDDYYRFISWHSRSDGHGSYKGGTYSKFINSNEL
jgi:hypothetical protein